MKVNKCQRCDFEWKPKKDVVKSCPNCKRYDWNQKKCSKCGRIELKNGKAEKGE